jgi:hypothetical protein
MKKVLLMTLAGILALSLVACKEKNSESQSSGTTSKAPQSTTAAPESDTTSPTSQTTAAPETDSVQTDNPDSEPNMITGTLYGPLGESHILEIDFGYEEGNCTPERIAEALSEWTGLVYDITATVDLEYDNVIVDWKSTSSFAQGEPPIPQKEGFEFYDQETMRWFMLNSLCSSIRVNMGISDVFYSIEGTDLNELGLEQDFNPAIAYNKIDNPNVVIK